MQVGCRRVATIGWGALLPLLCTLLAGIVLTVDLPLIHDHHEDGLYNEECPLGRLAAGAPRVPSPAATPAPGPLPACGPPAAPSWVAPALPPVLSGDPRGPPAAV